MKKHLEEKRGLLFYIVLSYSSKLYLIRVNFMLTCTLKCNISLRLCFGCVKQPNLTSHCDISNAMLIPSSKWKTVWTQAWKKLIKCEYLCLHSLPNDLPVETSYQWLLLTLPRLSEVVTSCSATIFSSVLWLSSTFQIHRKMYCNRYERIRHGMNHIQITITCSNSSVPWFFPFWQL